jgi:hypothetical protein
VGGLGGADIRKDHVARVIDLVHECAQHDKSLEDTVWLRPDMLQD